MLKHHLQPFTIPLAFIAQAIEHVPRNKFTRPNLHVPIRLTILHLKNQVAVHFDLL